MMREDEVVSEEVKAAIPLVVSGVTEEDTTSGPGGVCERQSRRCWGSRYNQRPKGGSIGGGCTILGKVGVG